MFLCHFSFRSQIKTDLTSKIESFSRANTDAIGALQSVVADHRRENEEAQAKLQAEVEKQLDASAENLRQAVSSFTADVAGETEKVREEALAGLGDLKAETTATFAEMASSVEAVTSRVAATQKAFEDEKKQREVTLRIQKQERDEYRQQSEELAIQDSIAGCVSDMVARLEGDDLVATVGVARREIDIISTTVKREAVEAAEKVDSRLTLIEEAGARERNAIRSDMTRQQEDVSTRLDGISSESVAESLKSGVVEKDLTERIASLEDALRSRLEALEAKEEAKIKATNDTLAQIREMIAKADEQRVRLEARVEGVVGQVEQERNEADQEWQASIAAAEVAEGEDDGGADGLSPRGDRDGELGLDGAQTGALPVTDVGFPPVSDA